MLSATSFCAGDPDRHEIPQLQAALSVAAAQAAAWRKGLVRRRAAPAGAVDKRRIGTPRAGSAELGAGRSAQGHWHVHYRSYSAEVPTGGEATYLNLGPYWFNFSTLFPSVHLSSP